MNLRKHGVASLVAAIVIGLSGLTATSAAAGDKYVTVTGKVTHMGKPVKGALVMADGTRGEGGNSATTDATGSYSVGELEAGYYLIWAEPRAHRSDGTVKKFDFLRTYGGNTVRETEATIYRVAEADTLTLDIKTIPGAVVKGKIVDAKGRPAKGVSVYASNTTRAGWGEDVTDSNGSYRISGLATGKVSITAWAKSADGSRRVTARQGSKKTVKTIKLKSRTLGTITGTVKGLKETDSVWIYDTKAKQAFQVTEPGKQTVKIKEKVAPGTYRLVVGGANKASKAVTVKAKKTSRAGTLIAPSKRTKVSGTVKGSNGKVLSGASVRVVDRYSTTTGLAGTDAMGTFEVSGVTSGRYTVSVYDARSNNAPTSVKLTVTKGEDATRNVTMAKGYKVTGTVRYGSKVLAGMVITARTARGGCTSTGTSWRGKFTLQGLPQGKVSLTASDHFVGGYLNVSKTATIKSKNIKWRVKVTK